MRVLIIEDEEKTADYLHRGLTGSEERRVGKECRAPWSPAAGEQRNEASEMHDEHGGWR